MATGFIVRRGAKSAAYFSALFLGCLLAGASAQAAEVGLVGLFPGKAVVVVDGGNPRTLSVGKSEAGVKLVSVDQNAATLEFDGKRHRLTIGQHAVSGAGRDGGGQAVTLVSDGRGHFITMGTINGATVRFMVDTGATSVALGASDARRANLDPGNGRPVMIQTANGVIQARVVQLNTVQVGEVTLHNVEATVAGHDMPQVLLGMSFLNRMDMRRDGEMMTLRKRY